MILNVDPDHQLLPNVPEPAQPQDYPLREAFRTFYPSYAKSHTVSAAQSKAAECIRRCKTGELGYTASYCPNCGYRKIRSRSCNNRTCSCCQAPMEKKWIMERNSELVSGIAYYHVVFTLPQELDDLVLANQKVLYDLLFSAATETLIGYTDYADGNQKKELIFSGEEFIERFLVHVLPKGFHRVRFSGFLANCVKTRNLTHIGLLRRTPYAGNPVKGKRTADLLMMIYGTDICSCPKCHHPMASGFMIHAPDMAVTE